MEETTKSRIVRILKCLLFVAIIAIICITLSVLSDVFAGQNIDSTELHTIKIASAEIEGDTLKIKAEDGTAYCATVTTATMTSLSEQNIRPTFKDDHTFWLTFIIGALVIGLILLVIKVVSLARSLAAFSLQLNIPNKITITPPAGMMSRDPADDDFSFTQAKIPSTRFSDVKGIDPIVEDMKQIVDCLKNPQKYLDAGVKIPRGVLLEGDPGCGKTLIAMAIAGEAGVSCIAVNGADFMEKFVGVGALRVRELYKMARSKAPCIVFIDEIDAIGASRSSSNDDREGNQTINALLSELDGFNSKEGSGVITICATNRADILDPALTRSGRLDLKLAVPLPDKKAREEILKLHSTNKTFDNVNFEEIAARTLGFSGADLATLLNEAGMQAVNDNRKTITSTDVDEAFFKLVMKGNKKANAESRKKLSAYHEAGHAIVQKLLCKERVAGVTIMGSMSGFGGVTFLAKRDEDLPTTKTAYRNHICVDYAGRAAEEIIFGKNNVTGGASQDIKQATTALKTMLENLGLGDDGLLLDITQFEKVNAFDEAKRISDELYKKTLSFLRSNIDVLNAVAAALLERETLSEAEFNAVVAAVTTKTAEAV